MTRKEAQQEIIRQVCLYGGGLILTEAFGGEDGLHRVWAWNCVEYPQSEHRGVNLYSSTNYRAMRRYKSWAENILRIAQETYHQIESAKREDVFLQELLATE